MTFLTSVRVRSQADVEGHVLQISVIPSSPWVIDKTSPISGSLHFFSEDGNGPTRGFDGKTINRKDAKLAI